MVTADSVAKVVEEMRAAYCEEHIACEHCDRLDAYAARLEALSQRSDLEREFVEAARKVSILCGLYEAHVIRKFLGEQSGDALIEQCCAYRRLMEGEADGR